MKNYVNFFRCTLFQIAYAMPSTSILNCIGYAQRLYIPLYNDNDL